MAFVSSTNTIAPGYTTWDDASMPINAGSNRYISCQDEITALHGNEGMLTYFFRLCIDIDNIDWVN